MTKSKFSEFMEFFVQLLNLFVFFYVSFLIETQDVYVALIKVGYIFLFAWEIYQLFSGKKNDEGE